MTQPNSQLENSKQTIDSHHHFFTKDSVTAFNRMIPPESYQNNPEFQQFFEELPTTEERAKLTVVEMEKSSVDKILPALIPFVDPRYDPPEIIDDYKKKGAVSVKFYPGSWGNNLNFNDPRIFPYLENVSN